MNAGYGLPVNKASNYQDKRVNLKYYEEVIMENVPINLAKWKKKQLIKEKWTPDGFQIIFL